jgi:uncharacterized protein YndB with AHSA1/START domain
MSLLTMDPEAFVESGPIGQITSYAPAVHAIVHEVSINASAQTVFDAATTREGLAAWWTLLPEASESTGISTVPFGSDEVTLQSLLVEAPEIVQWECVDGPQEWVGTSVALRIEQLPADITGGEPVSVVRFWHGGWAYEDGLMPRVSFQWALLLESLRQYAESRAASAA